MFSFDLKGQKWEMKRGGSMKTAIIVIGILLCLLILLFIMKITVKIDYCYQDHQDQLVIEIITFFGLIHKKWTIPVIKVSMSDDSVVIKKDKADGKKMKKRITIQKVFENIQGIQGIWSFLFESKESISLFFRKLHIQEFVWNSTFGLKDAASTGKLTGVFWTIKGIAQAVLFQFCTVRCKPQLSVVPKFNYSRDSIEVDFHCIFSFGLGNAIFTAIKLFFLLRRHKSSISSSLGITT